MKRILIADDHSIVRIGTTILMREVLGEETEVEEAATFDEALSVIQKGNLDLILLDINIPGGNNMDMINAIKLRDGAAKILVFSSYDESIFAMRYIKAGANGYLSKESGEPEFKKAIECVLSGATYISEELQTQSDQKQSDQKPDSGTIHSLSNREIEVMNLLIKGSSTTEISQALNIRLNTVSTYKANIYTKLEVNNVVDLIAKVNLHYSS